jgi:predicted RNA methylase
MSRMLRNGWGIIMGSIVKVFNIDNVAMFLRTIRKRGFLNTLRYAYYDFLFDLRYGTETVNVVELEGLKIESENKEHGVQYQPVTAYIFNQLFSQLNIDFENSTLVDFGCGKGRALILASHYGFKRIIGVEFSTELAEICKENLVKFRAKSNPKSEFDVLCMDVAHYDIPPEANVLLFCNPFGEVVIKKVIDNIVESLKGSPRTVLIIYIHAYQTAFAESRYTKTISKEVDWEVYEMSLDA